MSKDYISQNIDKIFNNPEFEYPKSAAMAASWVCAHFKGINLKVINAQKSSSLADFYILATAQNSTQALTMAETVSEMLKKHDMRVLSFEGRNDCEWILLDLGDVIVHIFQENSRELYGLDDLWMNLPQEQIPEEYYFSQAQDATPNKNDGPTGYF